MPMKPKRKKAPGKMLPASRPKLFGGTIQEYVAVSCRLVTDKCLTTDAFVRFVSR